MSQWVFFPFPLKQIEINIFIFNLDFNRIFNKSREIFDPLTSSFQLAGSPKWFIRKYNLCDAQRAWGQ